MIDGMIPPPPPQKKKKKKKNIMNYIKKKTINLYSPELMPRGISAR